MKEPLIQRESGRRNGGWPSWCAEFRPIPRAGRVVISSLALIALASTAWAQASVVDAVSPSAGLCPTHTPVVVPVTITRTGGPAIKGVSVTFQVSPNLALPAGTGSVAEGGFLSASGATSFHVLDNGGGSYTADIAVLGPSCGSTALTGTLFSVTVAELAASGSGTVTITDVIVRDCLNAGLPSSIGAAATVPIDFTGPSVSVLSPNGGESVTIGSVLPITWSANDPSGVSNVDVYLSRTGPGGPWTAIALGLPNTGSTTWTVTGPSVAGNAWVRVVAADPCGSTGADVSDAAFSIVDAASVVNAVAPGSGLCPAHTPVVVPVTLTRAGGPLIKGISVTFQVSPDLVLPAGTASVAEGGFMAAGGGTLFQVVDNGGGSYTVDIGVYSPSCGSPALTGTLFDVTLAAAATSGTGSVTVTNVQVRDCANAALPATIGTAASVPIDFAGPTVHVLTPNGGETFFFGQGVAITWTASDPLGVSSVDLELSRTGASGPWTAIATGVPNSGSYAWTATGPAAIGTAFVRVLAHDGCGSTGSDASDAGFTIADPASIVSAVSPPTGLCPAHTPVVVPVTLTRALGHPLIKGISVTFQLSPELVLPAGTASVTEGGFMATGGGTLFQVVDNGGGSYTVDIGVFSPSCGAPATSGTLFDVTVAAAATSGTGTVTVTSVLVRDCANAPLPATIGTVASVPIDFTGPAVSVLTPNGGESYFYGASVPITWTASDPLGVTSVDLYLSRSGPAGPWSPIALAVPNTGAYTWIATGPGVINNAFVRVVAHDGCGSDGEDRGDVGFSILDPATPTLVALFRVEDTPDGVRIQWQPGEEGAFSRLAPERAASPTAGWQSVAGEPRVDRGVRTIVDRDAPAGAESWYRLSGVLRGGGALTFGPLSVQRGTAVRTLALAAIRPNPVRDGAQLSFELPAATDVTLSLFDAQGRERSVLASGKFEPGRYGAVLDARDLRAGVYFVRLRAGTAMVQRSLVIVR